MKSIIALLAEALIGTAAAVAIATTPANAKQPAPSVFDLFVPSPSKSAPAPAVGTREVAFSPSGGAEALVVKVIDSAKSELRVLAYSFTSAPITAALLRAKKRGVDVRLVADHHNNVGNSKAEAALSALATAGVDVRLVSVFPIHHDKVLIADRETVELGSFNFSSAAESRNSENVLVNWHDPGLAALYLAHFDRNYRQATPYQGRAP
jgi:phosphatidylserine/phosphatidylglycerophosphate/cardiolipin synthase-like enzyme